MKKKTKSVGRKKKSKEKASSANMEQYRHKDEAVQRPGVGIQDQFQARKPPRIYRYDSSLDPALSWDEQRERDLGEWLLGLIERAAKEGEHEVFVAPKEWKGGGVQVGSSIEAIELLKSMSMPFLNWSGKSERQEVEVPTLPLFVHEGHSTKAILDGIRHRKARGQSLDLFGDPEMDIRDQLDAYEHKGPWQNRMILGDSMTVMNSLLEFEGLGGQVQMIYLDPPYGVKFGSNFQPFVRKRDVKHGKDGEMTREPEMVKAYRDTWELGLHSYLTYLRDRLIVSRELLDSSGCIFVQISDDNIHHVRELLDEVFGAENFCRVIGVVKTSGMGSTLLPVTQDYILWYARDISRLKYRQLFESKTPDGDLGMYTKSDPDGRSYRIDNLTGQNNNVASCIYEYEYMGKKYGLPSTRQWKTTREGMKKLENAGRLAATSGGLYYKRYLDDFPFRPLTNTWLDTGSGGFTEPKIYAVQTNVKVIQRCVLMSTDPGDLVLDPTCGSGTTAYVSEQWGRRWITIDTSRVPLALARQRILTATYPFYKLRDPVKGPAEGFVYEHKKNAKGEYTGGLIPHVTMKSFTTDERPTTEVLPDCPEIANSVTRVSGPFVVEAMIAPAQQLATVEGEEAQKSDAATHIDRMTEVLRQSRTLQLPGNRELVLTGIRRTSATEYLHAEAIEGDSRVAIVFGPQDGAISSITVYEAAREAHFLKYDRLYFFGFAIQAKAREMVENAKQLRVPASYVAVTPDVAMADLLKTNRASQIFSITGLPDFEIRIVRKEGGEDDKPLYEVELLGLDIFDPQTLNSESVEGKNVPCWMLDTDYDGMCFYASQVFFPKTSAWDNLQRSIGVAFDDSVWDHLAGTTSEPFAPGERNRVAVKVIDERGNELLRVRELEG